MATKMNPSDTTTDIILPGTLDGSVRDELQLLRDQLTQMGPAHLRDGSWFHSILQKSAERWLTRNDRPLIAHWREAHPDLKPRELGQKIIKRYAQRSALVGGTAGALVTTAEIGAFLSAGFTASAAIILVLAELGVIERLQVRMMFTLAQLYGYRMSSNDLQDIGTIYGNVLKIKGAARAATYARQGGVMMFRMIGLQFMRQGVIKFGVPVLSVGLGGAMNYVLTRSLGRHSEKIFDLHGQIESHGADFAEYDLRSRQIVVSLLCLMAAADGRIDRRERTLIKKAVSELAGDNEEKKQLAAAVATPEEQLFEAIRTMDSNEAKDTIIELLIIMAVADGQFDPAEKALLERIASAVNIPFDANDIHQRYSLFLKTTQPSK